MVPATDLIVSPYIAGLPPEMERAPRRTGERVFDCLTGHTLDVPRGTTSLLSRLRRTPRELRAFLARHPGRAQSLRARGLLVPRSHAFRRHSYRWAEIEVNTHCNYRCTFCPNRLRPKPRVVMPMRRYRRILDRISEYGGGIRDVKLHHYSEPLLDPHLLERIRLAADHALTVRLHTNGSLLDEERVRRLARIGNTTVYVNLPSVDRETYRRVTGGARRLDRVLDGIELLQRHRVRTRIVANLPVHLKVLELYALNRRLRGLVGEIEPWDTTTRAGALPASEYAGAAYHRGRLQGCSTAIDTVNVSVRGEAFLCCMDFDQRYVFGDLRTQSLRAAAESPRAVRFRQWCFGAENAPADFLCRRCAWNRSLASPGGYPAAPNRAVTGPKSMASGTALSAPPRPSRTRRASTHGGSGSQ